MANLNFTGENYNFLQVCKENKIKFVISHGIKEVMDIKDLDVSNLTDMEKMFYKMPYFNQDISAWDVSNVTTMQNLFNGCTEFDVNISNWDTSKVLNMSYMFYDCDFFDQPIGGCGENNGWNVGNVKYMEYMFYNAIMFNHPLNNWNVSNVENMTSIFYKAKSFDQPLSNWDLTKVQDLYHIFTYAHKFNQYLGNWVKYFSKDDDINKYIFGGKKTLDEHNESTYFSKNVLYDFVEKYQNNKTDQNKYDLIKYCKQYFEHDKYDLKIHLSKLSINLDAMSEFDVK
jgi:surface protein